MREELFPIAKREWRVASRRRGTWRLRWVAALVAIGVSAIWLLWFPAWAAATRLGGSLFGLQTACAFGLALLTGPFLTADCLSEEGRDGTLSLLFLTGLRARDIVLGKFMGTWLSAVYVLLALLPVTAIPIMLGGVSLAEFGRMGLALINTLFFSLAAGLGVSAFATGYARGVAGTLALLAVFGGLLPALAELAGRLGWPVAGFSLACSSPFYPFWYAPDTTYALEPHRFWVSLLAGHFTSWMALAVAGSKVRRSWQNTEAGLDRAAQRPRLHGSRRQPRPVTAGEAFDPVLTFSGNGRLLRWAAWLIVIVFGMLLGANRLYSLHSVPELFIAGACAWELKALVAFQACRFFVEARRSGALELLLCTPLGNSDLIQAQWRMLLRIFLWPLSAFLFLSWVTLLFPVSGASGAFLPPSAEGLPNLRTGCLGATFAAVRWAADVLAIGWFGMWLALTLRKPALAPALTTLAVVILPSLLVHFDLVADMLFISWGVTRLQEDFRRLADPTLILSEAPA